MTSSAIPLSLFRLPFLAIEEVFKACSLFELTKLSFTSKNAKYHVTRYTSRRQFEGTLKIKLLGYAMKCELNTNKNDKLSADITFKFGPCMSAAELCNFNGRRIPINVTRRKKTIFVYCSTVTDGFEHFLDYFTGCILKLTVSLESEDKMEDRLASVLRIIEMRRPALEEIKITNSELSGDLCEMISSLCGGKESKRCFINGTRQ